LRSSAEPIVELDDILRDALSDLLAADSRYGPVVDGDGMVRGVLSLEALGHALAATGTHVPPRPSCPRGRRGPGDGLADLARRRAHAPSSPVLAQLGRRLLRHRRGRGGALSRQQPGSARAGSWTTSRTYV
jgi:hypothetical protein